MVARKSFSKEQLSSLLELKISSKEMCARLGVRNGVLTRELKRHGLYGKFRLNIKSLLSTQRLSASSPERSKRQSEINKKRWSDPSFKQKMKEKLSDVWSNPELRKKSKENTTRIWTDSLFLERMSETAKKTWKNKELRDKQSDKTKKCWSDPEFRSKMSGIFNSPQFKDLCSKNSKDMWSTPGHRENFSKKIKLASSSEVTKTKRAIARENMPRSLTKPHLKVMALLDTLGFTYKPEKSIGPWNFDLFVPAKNLLIEVQGDYWHSRSDQIWRDKAKASYIANFKEYTLRYIWEHECLAEGSALSKLKYWLGAEVQKKNFDKEDLGIIQPEVKEADKFLYDFHYQHAGKHGTDFAGYIDGQIVVLARFAPLTRKEIATSISYESKQVLELTRLCVHPSYQQEGLLSWFLARCESQIEKEFPEVKCLVFFADKTHNDFGWKLVDTVEPEFCYVDEKGWVMHAKTLRNHANKNCIPEDQFAEQKGYSKLFGRLAFLFVREFETNLT